MWMTESPCTPPQNRGRSSTRSSSSMSQPVANRSFSSVHSSLPASRAQTPGGGAPRASTPKTSLRKERPSDDSAPATPRLPPRADHITSAPQVPPRARRGSSIIAPDSPISSQSTPPDLSDPKPPKPPPRPPPNEDTPLKTEKDIVDNSVWYEYGGYIKRLAHLPRRFLGLNPGPLGRELIMLIKEVRLMETASTYLALL
ncbi:hypothetical protein E2C01_021414 [Portunus trituberculatus]|uniref:Uncharacterized protein n=1 Tax=Portunus trituberculatus TaxID=210409 RepID=A0A5B7E4F1_PORTR|nr:hypothetical protein [Portunus trituberculatus]